MIKCIVWDLDETLWRGVLTNLTSMADMVNAANAANVANVANAANVANMANVANAANAANVANVADMADMADMANVTKVADMTNMADRPGGDMPKLSLNEEALRVARLAESRGIFQSIASRNDETAALRQLALLGMGGFFLYPRITPWIIKSQAVADIAAHFNIGLDSIAFVDDEPFERYEVSRFLPEVAVYAPDMLTTLAADIDGMAAPSGDRRVWMENREARLAAEKAFSGTRADFLRECRMRLTVRAATAADMARVMELAGRTHKYNTTPVFALAHPKHDPNDYRYDCSCDRNNLCAYLTDSDKWLFVCELDDRFGQHGLVGAGLFRRLNDALIIDQFCCSCRVEGRGVAAAFLNTVLQIITAREPSLTAVHCRVTKKRGTMALALFKALGFNVCDSVTEPSDKLEEGTKPEAETEMKTESKTESKAELKTKTETDSVFSETVAVLNLRLPLPCRDMRVAWIETRIA